MAVITISRQLGSLGTTLGRQVASRLGYRLVQREIINQAARIAGAPDMALATIDELGLLGIEPDQDRQEAYLQAVNAVIKELAEKGDIVIVGRAGQAILADHPGALHVRVVAPLETRVRRIVQAHGVSPKAARAQIEDSDGYRAQYLQRFYGIDWQDPGLYHMVVNSGKMSLALAAELISGALQHRSQNPNLQEKDCD
jgi:cytidylate kinase